MRIVIFCFAITLMFTSCKSRKTGSGGLKPKIATNGGELNTSLEVMQVQVNDYVEITQDVKMKYNSAECVIWFYVGTSLKEYEMKWKIDLTFMDPTKISKHLEEDEYRIEMKVIEGVGEVIEYFENGEVLDHVGQFNVYVGDEEKANKFMSAYTAAAKHCK